MYLTSVLRAKLRLFGPVNPLSVTGSVLRTLLHLWTLRAHLYSRGDSFFTDENKVYRNPALGAFDNTAAFLASSALSSSKALSLSVKERQAATSKGRISIASLLNSPKNL